MCCVAELLGLPITVEQYIEDIHKEYDKLFPTVPLLPGNILDSYITMFNTSYDIHR